MVDAVMQKPYGVFWWKNAFDNVALWAIVTERWRKAAGGIFCGNYPFWFDDLDLFEQWTMATDEEALGVNIQMADKPKNTMRMRELAFWCDFFNRMRPERIARGKDIARNLGLQEPRESKKFAEKMDKMVRGRMTPDVLAQIEKQGDSEAPDPSYLAAKADALKILERIAA